MKAKVIFIAAISIFFIFSSGFSEQNPGAENIILEGGESGVVPFPHKIHQDVLKDCNICHELFSQEIGSIEKLKLRTTLRPSKS
jgi:hypothetical protein